MRKIASLAAAALLLAIAGCKSDESARADDKGSAVASNTICPMRGEPVSADVQTVAFNGRQVGFCCDTCANKFAALSDTEKAAKLASN